MPKVKLFLTLQIPNILDVGTGLLTIKKAINAKLNIGNQCCYQIIDCDSIHNYELQHSDP